MKQPFSRALRRGVYLAVALFVAAGAGLVVFGGGARPVLSATARLPLAFVGLAALGTALEWALDTARYAIAGRAVGVALPLRTWLEVALVTLFASYVANVGIPVAAWLMSRRGVPAGDALAVTVGKNLLFFPAALLPAWLLMLASPDRASGAPLFGTLTVLVALSVLQLGVMLALALFPERAERVASRLPIVRRYEAAGRFVHGIARFFRGRPSLLLASLVAALANQAAIVFVVASLLHGFGGAAFGPGALARCYLFSTLSQVSPTPGGAGLSEVGGVLLLRGMLPDAALAAHVEVSRFFFAGLPILFGGLLLARELRRGERGLGRATSEGER